LWEARNLEPRHLKGADPPNVVVWAADHMKQSNMHESQRQSSNETMRLYPLQFSPGAPAKTTPTLPTVRT
jgi:hypothetical protein